MDIIAELRKKYKKRRDSAGRMKYPAGGADIYILCDMIDLLETVIGRLEQGMGVDE